jgi:hypothetical protein
MGTTLDITKVQKNPSRIWFGLAIPSASSYLTIGADGTPDATQNPSAKLIGLTEKGAMLNLSGRSPKSFTMRLNMPWIEQSTRSAVRSRRKQIRCLTSIC